MSIAPPSGEDGMKFLHLQKQQMQSEVERWLMGKPEDYRKEKMHRSLPNLNRPATAGGRGRLKHVDESFNAAGELKVEMLAEVEALEQLAVKKRLQVEIIARKHVALVNTRQRKQAKLRELEQKLNDATVEFEVAYREHVAHQEACRDLMAREAAVDEEWWSTRAYGETLDFLLRRVRDDLREDHERFDVLYKEACRLVAAVERQHPEPLMAANEWGAFKERCGEIRQDMERKARNWGFRISAERRELEIRMEVERQKLDFEAKQLDRAKAASGDLNLEEEEKLKAMARSKRRHSVETNLKAWAVRRKLAKLEESFGQLMGLFHVTSPEELPAKMSGLAEGSPLHNKAQLDAACVEATARRELLETRLRELREQLTTLKTTGESSGSAGSLIFDPQSGDLLGAFGPPEVEALGKRCVERLRRVRHLERLDGLERRAVIHQRG